MQLMKCQGFFFFFFYSFVGEHDSMRKSIANFFIFSARSLNTLFSWKRAHSFPCENWIVPVTITFLLNYFCTVKFKLRVVLYHNPQHIDIYENCYWWLRRWWQKSWSWMRIKFVCVNKTEPNLEFRIGLTSNTLEFSELVSAKVFQRKGYKIRC